MGKKHLFLIRARYEPHQETLYYWDAQRGEVCLEKGVCLVKRATLCGARDFFLNKMGVEILEEVEMED